MPAETIIHTIRHAHTRYNDEKRYAGSIDVALSEKGVADARSASRKLDGMNFDIVVTSSKQRAVETADLLVGGRCDVLQSDLCDERNFGKMEGHTWEEVRNFDPPVLFIEVGNDLHSVNPQGGEFFEEVWERAGKFRNFLFSRYEGKNILVVSHGVFLQMFNGLLGGSSMIESLAVYPSNLELSSFTFSGDKLLTRQSMKLDGVGANF